VSAFKNFICFSMLSPYLGDIYIIFICFTSIFFVFKSSIFRIDSLATHETVIVVPFFFVIFFLLDSYLFIWIKLLNGSIWC
jgi:hypothetical protein